MWNKSVWYFWILYGNHHSHAILPPIDELLVALPVAESFDGDAVFNHLTTCHTGRMAGVVEADLLHAAVR